MNLNLLKSVKGILGAVAPTIGTALGGPMGGMAAKMVAEALGVDNDPKKIEKAIQAATPEQLAELKQIDADFDIKMKELDVDLFALETADIQSARGMFSKDWTARIIGITVVGGFMGYIFLVTIQPPEQNSEALINLVLGYLGGLASAIISFYFGASNTSNKDQQMVIQTTNLYKALELKYEAQEAEAKANLEIYFKNSAGIGEHPDVVEAMDQQIDKLSQAQDKLNALKELTL